ncbi:MAG: PHP domain-containing protein [Planctomycetota bacterium]
MIIRRDYRLFDVSPRVVPAGRETTIEIRPLQAICTCEEYEIAAWPMDGYGSAAASQGTTFEPLSPTDGVIRFTRTFEAEQEHVLSLTWTDWRGRQGSAEFRIYSLHDDLFARRPYKGDMHIHSYHSDGAESPAYMAGACRQAGLDFMAVTDHGMYGPSLEAIQAFEGVAVDMRVYPGEEVHLPSTTVHIVNFGGARSVNMACAEDHEPHLEDIKALADQIGPLPDGVDSHAYAECVWAFDRIREAEGLAIYCHPYWVSVGRYHPGMPLANHLFDTQLFDAYEVVGGYDAKSDSNTLQAARYYEETAKGRKLPVVGVTDAHSCRFEAFLGRCCTIVFSPTSDLGDLISSIKDLCSIAVESLPNDRPRPVGPTRLVKYALYLEREIFPQHDELCEEEGRLMMALATGDSSAADLLGRVSGQTKALYDRFWASV